MTARVHEEAQGARGRIDAIFEWIVVGAANRLVVASPELVDQGGVSGGLRRNPKGRPTYDRELPEGARALAALPTIGHLEDDQP